MRLNQPDFQENMTPEKFKLSSGSSVVLDVVRAVSSQVVVFGHGISIFGILTFLHEPYFPWIQNIAVVVFFLLSGFLITYSTVRKAGNDLTYGFRHYFVDRFSRIYTAFVPAIIFVLLVDSLALLISPTGYQYSKAFGVTTFIANIFMLQDFPLISTIDALGLTSFGSGRPFWSLAIEWWIYMFFGYFLLTLCRGNKITFTQVALLGLFSVVPVYNLIFGRGQGLTVYWLFGSLVYFFLSSDLLFNLKRGMKILIVLTMLTLATVRVVVKIEAYDAIFAFLLAASMLLLIDLFRDIKFSDRAIKTVNFSVSYSFTLYLVHYSVLAFIHMLYAQSYSPYILFLCSVVIANLLALAIGYVSEEVWTPKVRRLLSKMV